MRVLLIGGGGREHAIAWKLAQSPRLRALFIAPGNAGTAEVGENIALPIPKTTASASEIEAYLAAVQATALSLRVELVIVAPDDPLAWGLVDRLLAAGIACFGPSQAASKLEASKAWAKRLMERHGIPHTRTRIFDDAGAARAYVRSVQHALVVKADGLAVGKGAIVTSNTEEALAAIDELSALGEAGNCLTIEDRITAREVSAHGISDGKTVLALPLSCDHKTVFENGRGPNTGGMGVYSPPWWASPELGLEIASRVLAPLALAMAGEGVPFRGVIYPGVFVNEAGIQVFECNARFGDPEAQALLVRLRSDLLTVIEAAVNVRLHELSLDVTEHTSVCVVMASSGYPGRYATGLPISGLDQVDADVRVFHAGTRRAPSGELLTAGGRVLSVVATDATLAGARRKAYANVERIHFEGAHYRRDIGLPPDAVPS